MKIDNPKITLIKSFTISLIPLLVYFIIDELFGLYWGVIAALIFGVLESLYYRIKDKKWDKIAILSTVLIVFLGLLSLMFNSAIFVMMKPVIFEGFFSVALFIIYFMKIPFFQKLSEKHLKDIKINPVQEQYFSGLTLRFAILLLVHAVILAVAVFDLNKKAWIFIKGILFYAFFGLIFLFEFFYSKYFYRTKTIFENKVFIKDILIEGIEKNEMDYYQE